MAVVTPQTQNISFLSVLLSKIRVLTTRKYLWLFADYKELVFYLLHVSAMARTQILCAEYLLPALQVALKEKSMPQETMHYQW